MSGLTLRVITPDRIALDEQTEAVRLPGLDGSMGVLPRHAHMVAALDAGELRYRKNGHENFLFVAGGFAEVRDGTVRVVSEAGERPADIDEERARAAERRARERLASVHKGENIDVLRAEAALHRAMVRMQIKERGH
jgi:F-type H+-transporting ATPase subunit epsilon